MATCPNKNTEAWQLLVTSRGEDVAHYLWDKYDGVVPESESRSEIVKSGLKATNILQSPKADQFFNAVAKNKISGDFFWRKMQADLGIPKDQLEILKSFNTQDRGELISSLLANYSYAVEINTAKDRTISDQYVEENGLYYRIDSEYGIKTEISKENYDLNKEEFPTNYYSDLTVPGGTNYTENEIATPAITPSIKGHAQFATDKGIGWFRSDDKDIRRSVVKDEDLYFEEIEGIGMSEISKEEYENANIDKTKTRRILELQSDLFQKGRENKYLISNLENTLEEMGLYTPKKMVSSNQFLQLLNKDNNWVTFFVRAIIQDSAKKGYEKVLFPSGETAAKVEGHETLANELQIMNQDLENFKSDLEIEKIALAKLESFRKLKEEELYEYNLTKDSLEREITNLEGSIFSTDGKIYKLELDIKHYKDNGIEKLKPIENFYENTVKNVLNKQYGKENVKQVTDEYGNTWNEIEIAPEREQQPILLQLPKEGQKPASPELIKLMKEFIKQIGVDYKLVENIVVDGVKQDANGVALIMQKLIQVVEGQEDVALPEEVMHFAVEIVKQTNPKLYQQLLKEINNHPKKNEVFTLYGKNINYQKDGKPDVIKLKEEAIAQVLAERLNDSVAISWWKKVAEWLKALFFGRSGLDQTVMDVLSGKIANVEDIDVNQGNVYFQLNEGEKIFNNIRDTSNKLELKEDGKDENGKVKFSYFLDGEKLKNRVSDRVKNFYERIFGSKDINENEFIKAVNDLKAEKGTDGHADIENAYKVLVDPDTGLLREETLDDSGYVSQLNPDDRSMYDLLRNNLNDRLRSFPEGTRFMSEVKIADIKRSLAGTIDFLAITPDGKVNILDWKFMDLNTDRYDDVPWYKVRAWDMQMTDYKNILISQYKIKNENFGQTRMIPILAMYTRANYEKEILPRLKEIKIGDVVVQNIEEDYLLPVGITGEKTGNKKVDNLLEKLNSVYRKLSEEKVSDSEKSGKAEQLNALYKAIRHLQIKGNVVPLINQAKILNKQVAMLLKRYASDFEGKTQEEVPQDKINSFAGMIRVHLEALQPYLDIDQLRSLLTEDTEENTKLKENIAQTVQNVRDYISDLEELDITFGEKFNSASSTPEKVVKGFTKWFSSIPTIQISNLQSLYKLANKAFFLSNQETLEEVNKLEKIKQSYDEWANRKGLSISNYFNIIMKSDKNELIDQFDRKFYDELKSKIAKKDGKWISENIDVDVYREYVDNKIEQETERIYSRPRVVATVEEVKKEIQKDLAKLYNKYNLENKSSNGWLLYDEIKRFPKKDKWESSEFKILSLEENAPAKAFYDYIVERNEYFQEVGYLNGKAARKFLPFVRKGFIESLMFDGKSRGLGEQFLRNISMDDSEVGYGEIDPVTGEVLNSIPRYFTRDIGEDYSTDLFRTMTLYNQFAIRYKNLSDIEERSRQLLRIERNKKSIATSQFGKIKLKDGAIEYNENNSENSKLLEDMIKSVVYQQKYIESEVFDVALGKISSFGKTINEKLGITLFPEDLEERQISFNKSLDVLNKNFQFMALGLNSLSALSNLFGGTTNSLINAGKYFTKTEYLKLQMWLLANKMQRVTLGKSSLGEDPLKALSALDYFMPFVDNYNRDATKKLSLSKIDEQSIQDVLMVFMRNGDEAVQTLNYYAFLNNAIIIDGKIQNVREYLRNTEEYKNFYKGTQEERKERKNKFEKDVEKLLEENSVLKLGQLDENGKFYIPGIDKKSDTVMEFRRLVQSFSSDALGSMTEENRRLINMNVYSNSFMVFKNWIPRLVDVRIGDLKYNAASDAYEWGRIRMVFNLLSTDISKSINSLKAAISGDGDVWLNQIRDLYERKSQEYMQNTGKTLEMTEDEFIALVNQNIKNQVVDLSILLGLMSLLALAKAAAPDDDEDPRVKNQWRFLVKATDKLTDELSYFYDPTSLPGLVSKGIFPSLGLLENYTKFIKNFALENFGIIMGDQEIQDDAKPIKYLMKSFPISSQMAGYLPMFYPELAKDLGIKMQSQYGMR